MTEQHNHKEGDACPKCYNLGVKEGLTQALIDRTNTKPRLVHHFDEYLARGNGTNREHEMLDDLADHVIRLDEAINETWRHLQLGAFQPVDKYHLNTCKSCGKQMPADCLTCQRLWET